MKLHRNFPDTIYIRSGGDRKDIPLPLWTIQERFVWKQMRKTAQGDVKEYPCHVTGFQLSDTVALDTGNIDCRGAQPQFSNARGNLWADYALEFRGETGGPGEWDMMEAMAFGIRRSTTGAMVPLIMWPQDKIFLFEEGEVVDFVVAMFLKLGGLEESDRSSVNGLMTKFYTAGVGGLFAGADMNQQLIASRAQTLGTGYAVHDHASGEVVRERYDVAGQYVGDEEMPSADVIRRGKRKQEHASTPTVVRFS